jgi:hypothetical protein
MDLRPVVSKLRFLVKVHTPMKDGQALKKRIGMARRFVVPMACALRELSAQPG